MDLFERQHTITFKEIDEYINLCKKDLDSSLHESKLDPEKIKYLMGGIDALELIKEKHTFEYDRSISATDPLNRPSFDRFG